MIDKKNSVFFGLMNIVLFVYFLELVFPPITVYGDTAWICIFCLVIWFGLSFINEPAFYLTLNYHRLYLFAFLFCSIIFPYVFGVGTYGNRYVSLALIPFGIIIFDYYKRFNRLRHLKMVVMSIVPFILYTTLNTLKRLLENPFIVRSIKSSGEYSEELARQGIGSYGFVYFMVVVGVILLYIFLKTANKWMRFSVLLGYILTLYFIFKTNYVTALVALVVSSAILLYVYIGQRGKRNRVIMVIAIALGAFLLLSLDNIVLAIEDYLPERLARAIVPEGEQTVVNALFEEFTADRWPTMLKSLEAFRDNLLFGLMGKGEINNYLGFISDFGQHSHIVDTFAIFGVFLGIMIVFAIFAPFKDMNGKWIKEQLPLTVAICVCTVLIYLFNNATSTIAFAITIIFPLVREYYINPSSFAAPKRKEDV